jgi:hypothetical protein
MRLQKVGTAEPVIKKSLYRSIPHCLAIGEELLSFRRGLARRTSVQPSTNSDRDFRHSRLLRLGERACGEKEKRG